MARPESISEDEVICVRSLYKKAGIDSVKCSCPKCTGRGNRMVRKDDILFPELLKKAVEKDDKKSNCRI